MTQKLCAGCQTRPRRYACLRCGDALCRRCVAARACCSLSDEIRERGRTNIVAPAPERVGAALAALEQVAPVQPAADRLITDLMTSSATRRDVKPPDIFQQLCALPPAAEAIGGSNSVTRGTPETSSAANPPPAALLEAPATSTPRDCPPSAGGGLAVSSTRLTVREFALRMLATQPTITALQLARESDRELDTCKTTLWGLKKTGVLQYWPVAKAEQRRGVSGTYSLPGASIEVAKPEVPPARPVVPPPTLRRVPSASAVTTGPSSVALHPRARGPVPGQHTKAADFFADKPKLPAARAPQVSERGGQHA